MEFNDIGISSSLDWPRIKKLLTIGLVASLLHFAGDMALGWGVEDESLVGIPRMLSAYAASSDGTILAAALLGLFGMVLEGLSMFGIYRLMAFRSPKAAHSYRSGIFGYLMFGPCGFHVPVCAMAYLLKHGLTQDLLLGYIARFFLPAFALFWVFFLVLSVTQIKAFLQGNTPCPKWCWVFSMPVGMVLAMLFNVLGNHPLANAMSCAWIAFGGMWMFGGLLAMSRRVE